MTVRLTVRRNAWLTHVRAMAAAVDGVVPVVKGNGYGFGRATLHPIADSIANDVCVGTVHELDHIADGVTPVVLTPTLAPPADTAPVLTVGSVAHVDALRGWQGRVLVKLESSIHRYGVSPHELHTLIEHAGRAGLDVVGTSIHLPLAGDDRSRVDEIEAWLTHLDPALPLWTSHLDPQSFAVLQRHHPRHTLRLRLGTALWHGDKSFVHLWADVVDVRSVAARSTAGYRHVTVPADGHIVLVGAGSAHGVAPLGGGLSPLHYAGRRVALLEPPHMHTSMGFIPLGAPCPAPGDRVDLQRPLISTQVDEIDWQE